MKQRALLKNKILLVIFGVLIFIFSGETIFRISGLFARRPKVNISQDSNSYKIVCIGDSMTYGIGATDIDKFSYAAQLQDVLNNTGDEYFEVINLGIPGINSSQVLNRFHDCLLRYDPHAVIVMIGANDSWNLKESNILKFYQTNFLKRMLLNFELLLHESKLFRLIMMRLQPVLNANDSLTELAPEHPLDEIRMRQGFTLYSDNAKAAALRKNLDYNLKMIAEIARDNNVVIIFMKYHTMAWGGTNIPINEIYSKLRLPVVDNTYIIPEAKRRGLEVLSTHPDDWHFNDLGYLILAKNVYNKLVELEIIDGELLDIFEKE